MITLKIKGMNKVLGNLKKIARENPEKVENAMFKITSSAADAARARGVCPYDTGNLSSSIDNMVKRRLGEIIGIVFTPVIYGIFVHFGTYKMAARPFMNKAIEYIERHAVPVFKRELGLR